jgi:hypothetical protein
MSRAGNWSKSFKEKSQISFGTTYSAAGSITLEGAVMDLQIGIMTSINSPALEVACGPPGIRAKIQIVLLQNMLSGGAEK